MVHQQRYLELVSCWGTCWWLIGCGGYFAHVEVGLGLFFRQMGVFDVEVRIEGDGVDD